MITNAAVRSKPITDLMTCRPCTLTARATIEDARHALRTSANGELFITDDHGLLLGVVRPRDVEALTGGGNAWLPDTGITILLAGAPLFIDHDDDVEEAARLMVMNDVSVLPVVGPALHIVGIVTRQDVLGDTHPASGRAGLGRS